MAMVLSYVVGNSTGYGVLKCSSSSILSGSKLILYKHIVADLL